MFRSKTVGWITALTLLFVAGMALACRLKDGTGPASRADINEWAAGAKDATPVPPPPPPTPSGEPPAHMTQTVEPGPLPTPAPADHVAAPVAPPLPSKQEEPLPMPGGFPLPPPPPAATPPALPAEKTKPESAKPTAPPPVALEPQPTTEAIPAPLSPITPLVKPDLKEPVATPLPAKPKTPSVTPAAPATSTEAKVYWASPGETLRDVARKTLGSETRWKELDRLNPTLRSGTIIPTGTMVRLPSDASAPLAGKESEAEVMPPARTPTGLKPLPVLRFKKNRQDRDEEPLTGSHECKLDGKRGLIVPKDVLEQFVKNEALLLTPGPDQCLWLVGQSGAARLMERIEKAQVLDADVHAFRRLFYSQSEKCWLNSASRFEVPAKLADYAGLSGDVVLIGNDDHFELWEASRWHRYSQQKATIMKGSKDSE